MRKLAKELGIDLASVAGTGPAGRITADDVRAAADGGGGTAEPASAGSTLAGSTRRAIADNLERQAAIPQVTIFRTVDCTALEARRGELGVSPLPLVIAALTRTVAEHTRAQRPVARRRRRGRERRSTWASPSTPNEGWWSPVAARSREPRHRRARRARSSASPMARASGSLTPAEMTGATVAVSNTGSYGSEAGTPILSPGTSITLAIGVIGPRALVVDGEVVARPACTPELHVRPPGARRRHRRAGAHRPGEPPGEPSRPWETCRA